MLWRGRWRPQTIEPARYLYDHELVLVTEGNCTVEMDNTLRTLRAGDYLIIPPNTYHVTTTDRGVYRNCIHFDWEPVRKKKAQPIFRLHPRRPEKSAVNLCPFELPKDSFAGKFPKDTPFIALIETLFHRWQNGDAVGKSLARATFLELLILLLNPATHSPRAAGSNREHAYAVRDLLEKQVDSTIGIQELLASTGFSYPHMTRLFRSAFGITPVEYRNALRLERAKSLLKSSSQTIAEIGYAVGFKDAAYFSRQFRKQNNATPKEFRDASVAFREMSK